MLSGSVGTWLLLSDKREGEVEEIWVVKGEKRVEKRRDSKRSGQDCCVIGSGESVSTKAPTPIGALLVWGRDAWPTVRPRLCFC
jgi:hypothetical protein